MRLPGKYCSGGGGGGGGAWAAARAEPTLERAMIDEDRRMLGCDAGWRGRGGVE
jgi:hypothetical protein